MIASFLDREPAGGWLSLVEAEALLATHGIPFAPSDRCQDVERAVAVAAEIGAPVALKADFAAPAHASDIDAVLLGLKGEPAVRSCWRELERRVRAAGREWTGAIIQRLVEPGSMGDEPAASDESAEARAGGRAEQTSFECWFT